MAKATSLKGHNLVCVYVCSDSPQCRKQADSRISTTNLNIRLLCVSPDPPQVRSELRVGSLPALHDMQREPLPWRVMWDTPLVRWAAQRVQTRVTHDMSGTPGSHVAFWVLLGCGVSYETVVSGRVDVVGT